MLSKVTENRKSLFEIGLCKSKPIHSRDPDPAGTSIKFDILEALAFYVFVLNMQLANALQEFSAGEIAAYLV